MTEKPSKHTKVDAPWAVGRSGLCSGVTYAGGIHRKPGTLRSRWSCGEMLSHKMKKNLLNKQETSGFHPPMHAKTPWETLKQHGTWVPPFSVNQILWRWGAGNSICTKLPWWFYPKPVLRASEVEWGEQKECFRSKSTKKPTKKTKEKEND